MKKIAFLLNSMNMGGTEKALLSMINAIDRREVDITIFLLEKKGELLPEIPSNISVKTIEEYNDVVDYVHESIYTVVKKEITKGHIIKAFKLGFAYCLAKRKNDIYLYYDAFSDKNFISNETYDLVAAYQGPMNYITYLVSRKFDAKKRAAWIHFDIAGMGYSRRGASKVYEQINQVFAVSEFAKQRFIEEFPECSNKTKVFLNILPEEIILRLGEERIVEQLDKSRIKILTIGRISNQKGQDMIPEIIHRLQSMGDNVIWYLIGGIEQCDSYDPLKKLKGLIEKYSVEDNVVWLGVKENPYPYIRECNIYVQPSRYEGYCTTTNEAKLFNVPIITTDVSGANEQFVSGQNGIITAINPEEIANAIHNVISDATLAEKLVSNLKRNAGSNGNITPLIELL